VTDTIRKDKVLGARLETQNASGDLLNFAPASKMNVSLRGAKGDEAIFSLWLRCGQAPTPMIKSFL